MANTGFSAGGFEVRVWTDTPCKRCHGKGWTQWGSIYGPCNRCGGESGKESIVDIGLTLKALERRLVEIQSEGNAAKERLNNAVGRLEIGSATRALAHARKQYAQVLLIQRKCQEEAKN